MDLQGELLREGFRQRQLFQVDVTRIHPRFKRILTASPQLKRSSRAFNIDRLLNRFWFYPIYLGKLRDEFDLFHVVDHSYGHLVNALRRAKTVVSCHDLDSFRCILEPQQERRPFLFRAMTRQILKGLQRANVVVCDSRWTRNEIVRYDLLPAERLKVVPAAIAPEFSQTSNAEADRTVDKLLGDIVAHPLLLHVGSTIPRKRIDVLLKVFAGIHRELPNTRLIRVGGPFNREQIALLKSLSIQDLVLQLEGLPRDVLAAVYRRARLLLLPSEREGFGLPLVEAMACGTPVLASDLPVLREIGGDAVEYCAVGDIAQWTDRARSLLISSDHDSTGSSVRRRRSIEIASHLACSTYAEKILNIYTELLGQDAQIR
jgi:glycosyltransferase involved in cell wall biosynthesis